MRLATKLSALVLFTLIVSILACAAPKRDYGVDKISNVDDLEELMYVQATVADKRLRLAKRLDPDFVSVEQFAQFADMGKRLAATAKRLPRFSKGENFDRFASELGRKSAQLEEFANARDGRGTVQTALSIEKTCAACHDEYR